MSSNPSPESPADVDLSTVTDLDEYRRLVHARVAAFRPAPPPGPRPDPAKDAWDEAWDEEEGYTFRLDNS